MGKMGKVLSVVPHWGRWESCRVGEDGRGAEYAEAGRGVECEGESHCTLS